MTKKSETTQKTTANTDKPKPTITISYPCKVSKDEGIKDYSMAISIPMRSLNETKEIMEDQEEYIEKNSAKLEKWAQTFTDSVDQYVEGDSFSSSLKRETGDWRQEVLGEDDSKIRISAATGKMNDGGNGLSGDGVIVMVNRALDLGTIVKVPLWHSGFWVTIKAPSAATLMSVDRILSNQKIILGRQTNGMVFSSVSAYIRKTLVDLISECIAGVSIKDYKKERLFKLIKIPDYYTLLWGVCCANYPNGYDLIQPCVSDIKKCVYVAEERVMLTKLSWVDNNSLTKEQKKFVQKQQYEKVPESQIIDYQVELTKYVEVSINEKISVVLSTPNIKEDLDSGVRWIDSIVDMVEELFKGEKLTDEMKNMRILEFSKLSALRQYASWINKIILKNEDSDSSVVDDRDTISTLCESLTKNTMACKLLFEAVGKYIDDSIISIIGIPNYTCPSCNAPQSDKDSKYPEIIPLSIESIFFTLIRQLTNRLIRQENTF